MPSGTTGGSLQPLCVQLWASGNTSALLILLFEVGGDPKVGFRSQSSDEMFQTFLEAQNVLVGQLQCRGQRGAASAG